MKKGHIFFISGVCGAGKGTVIQGLLKNSDLDISLVLSCKTRKPRPDEIVGEDYIYMTKGAFHDAINRGEFLEYNLVHNQDLYGTRFSDVIQHGIDKGRNIIKEIDITILPYILKTHPELRPFFTYIFLDLPIKNIKDRMIARGDSVEGSDFENRMCSAQSEKQLMHLADFVIDAQKPKNIVLQEVQNIIANKLQKRVYFT